MSHDCKCECKHKNVNYCKKCNKVHCLDCGKEWPEHSLRQWVDPYWWYYPYQYDPYRIMWTDATTGNEEGVTCEMTYASSPHQFRISGNVEGGGSHPDYN